MFAEFETQFRRELFFENIRYKLTSEHCAAAFISEYVTEGRYGVDNILYVIKT